MFSYCLPGSSFPSQSRATTRQALHNHYTTFYCYSIGHGTWYITSYYGRFAIIKIQFYRTNVWNFSRFSVFFHIPWFRHKCRNQQKTASQLGRFFATRYTVRNLRTNYITKKPPHLNWHKVQWIVVAEAILLQRLRTPLSCNSIISWELVFDYSEPHR